MLQRVKGTILVLSLAVLVIFFVPNWTFCLVVVWLSGMALYEFYAMVEHKGVAVYKYFGTALGMLVPIAVYLEYDLKTEGLAPFAIVLFSLFVFARQFAKKGDRDVLVSTAVTLFGILYISWFFSFIIKVIHLTAGGWLVLFLILVTKGGDMGAYVIGSQVGRRPLIPRISPKKTVEGTIGGLVVSFLLAVILSPMLIYHVRLWQIPVMGVLLAVLGQVGDLSESLLKRSCGVKDSSGAIAGLGGMLDILDSLFFTTPIFYFILKAFSC